MKSNHHWAMKIGTEGDWDALSGRDTTKSPSTTKSRKTLCLTRHIKGCVFSSTTCAPSFSGYFAFACAGESEGHPVSLFQPVLQHSMTSNWWLLLALWLPAPLGFRTASSLWSERLQLLSCLQGGYLFGSRCWIRPMQLIPQLIFSSLATGYRSLRMKSKIFDPDEAAAYVTCIGSWKAEGLGQVSSRKALSSREGNYCTMGFESKTLFKEKKVLVLIFFFFFFLL